MSSGFSECSLSLLMIINSGFVRQEAKMNNLVYVRPINVSLLVGCRIQHILSLDLFISDW